MDPPAGFVRACNPAVAAPRAPAPRGRTFPGRPPPGSHREPRSAPARSVPLRPQSPPEMPVDFTGYWKMLANENFEEYLRALGKRCPPRSARGARPGRWGWDPGALPSRQPTRLPPPAKPPS